VSVCLCVCVSWNCVLENNRKQRDLNVKKNRTLCSVSFAHADAQESERPPTQEPANTAVEHGLNTKHSLRHLREHPLECPPPTQEPLAMMSGLSKFLLLFCKRALQIKGYLAKEAWKFTHVYNNMRATARD